MKNQKYYITLTHTKYLTKDLNELLSAAIQTNIYFAITNVTTERVTKNHWQLPRELLRIGFCEVHAKYKGKYHIAWSIGFFTQFPVGKIFRERDFCRLLGDAPENPRRHQFLHNLFIR